MARIVREGKLLKGELPLPLLKTKRTWKAKYIWGILDSFGEEIFAGRAAIAIRAGVSISTVDRACAELEEYGWLKMESGKDKAEPNVYHLLIPKESNEFSTKTPPTPPENKESKCVPQTHLVPPTDAPSTSHSGTPYISTESKLLNQENQNLNPTPQTPGESMTQEIFPVDIKQCRFIQEDWELAYLSQYEESYVFDWGRDMDAYLLLKKYKGTYEAIKIALDKFFQDEFWIKKLKTKIYLRHFAKHYQKYLPSKKEMRQPKVLRELDKMFAVCQYYELFDPRNPGYKTQKTEVIKLLQEKWEKENGRNWTPRPEFNDQDFLNGVYSDINFI